MTFTGQLLKIVYMNQKLQHYSCFTAMLFLLLFFACQSKDLSPETEKTEQNPLFIVKPAGIEPFFFELGAKGPVLIPSPEEASLAPFMPWTHSRHIASFLPIRENSRDKEEVLYAAVNRSGVLELRDHGREKNLFFHGGEETWDDFQVAAFFRYNTRPTAFLVEERFFSVEGFSPLLSPLWAVWDGSLTAISIPGINPEHYDDWTTNSLFLGNDGFWYTRKSMAMQENKFHRTSDLSEIGQEIRADQYQQAISPMDANSSSVQPLLSWTLGEAARLAGRPCITTVVSPDFPSKRLISSYPTASGSIPSDQSLGRQNENGEFPMELYGYYRQHTPGKEALVAILFPDGRGVYCRSDGTFIKDGHFALPALHNGAAAPAGGNPADNPGSFVYTGVALLGDGPRLFIVASWEEQRDWNIGAAGFLMLEINW